MWSLTRLCELLKVIGLVVDKGAPIIGICVLLWLLGLDSLSAFV